MIEQILPSSQGVGALSAEAVALERLLAERHSCRAFLPDEARRSLLRSLFTAGARAVIRSAKIHGTRHRPWLTGLLARRPTKIAAIALANKLARMAWAMMARNESYKEPAALAA